MRKILLYLEKQLLHSSEAVTALRVCSQYMPHIVVRDNCHNQINKIFRLAQTGKFIRLVLCSDISMLKQLLKSEKSYVHYKDNISMNIEIVNALAAKSKKIATDMGLIPRIYEEYYDEESCLVIDPYTNIVNKIRDL